MASCYNAHSHRQQLSKSLSAKFKSIKPMQKDALHRFIFDNTPIRGNIVQLEKTLNETLQYHDYPVPLRNMLGELMAASALLSATLKMDGALILQIQGKGALKLLVVECTAEFGLRATAKWNGDIDESDFKSIIGDGHCVITLDPEDGEPYQGIVPIEGESIAEMLENYMLRSQQIDTKLWLTCDGTSAAGMLIQKLPNQKEQDINFGTENFDIDAWNRIGILADTVTNDELQTLAPETLLTRLFVEENVRLFAPKSTAFKCSCSRANVANMLHMLGKDEVDSILAERSDIEVNCDFCNQQYQFDAVDAAALFVAELVVEVSKAKH